MALPLRPYVLRCLLLVLVVSTGARAQVVLAVFEGYVWDAMTGAPLEGANVSLFRCGRLGLPEACQQINATLRVDSTGRFGFAVFHSGAYALRIQSDGHVLVEAYPLDPRRTFGMHSIAVPRPGEFFTGDLARRWFVASGAVRSCESEGGLEGARLTLASCPGGSCLPGDASATVFAQEMAGERGVFDVRGTPPGQHRDVALWVEHAGFESISVTPHAEQDGLFRTHSLCLAPARPDE